MLLQNTKWAESAEQLQKKLLMQSKLFQGQDFFKTKTDTLFFVFKMSQDQDLNLDYIN